MMLTIELKVYTNVNKLLLVVYFSSEIATTANHSTFHVKINMSFFLFLSVVKLLFADSIL